MDEHRPEHEHEHEHGRESQRDSLGAAFDSDRVAGVLEVEGEAASGVAEQAIALCAGLLEAAALPVRRVVDIGCGPGVSTASLANSFPSATVLAVDGSSTMLERAKTRAARLGHGARVETRQLDINKALRTVGRFDLAWAAMAIHHADDEVATLRDVRSLLNPSGLLCLLERAEPTGVRFEHDFGRPGIWDRLDAARREWFESVRERMPGADKSEAYPSMLVAAEMEIINEQTLSDAVEARQDDATRQFITGQLQRTAKNLAGFADGPDLEILQVAADESGSFPTGLWEGATITLTRTLFIATPSPS